MKKNILKLSLLSLITVFAVSCGDKKKSETTDAEEALEVSDGMTTYKADVDGSQIEWEGGKLTGIHTGYLNISEGFLSLDENNQIAAGEFVIAMSSITVTDLEGEGKEKLEAHLKGTVEGQEGDFFDINKYPEGKFAITGMEVLDGKTSLQTMEMQKICFTRVCSYGWMQGNLTLKENTRNVKFFVNMALDGDKMILQSEEFSIDRTEWEINYGSRSIFPNIGDKVIYDEMKISIYLEADKA